MEIFKFRSPTHPTLLEQGELVNNINSKLWIERYRDFGDFELVSDVEANVHLYLPIGTLISHTESTEVMVVENHEITETVGSPTQVKITGRSFESFFENRIVGANKEWPTEASATEEYILAEGFTWDQAVAMLKDHIDVATVIDPDDGIQYLEVLTDIVATADEFERSIPRGTLYTRLIELLAIDNLGIKVIRPGVRSPLGFESPNMAVVVHQGVDLSQDVAFSYSTGEIQSADYLWSNKRLKNAALVTGRWLEAVVTDASVGYQRRWMEVDGSDLDNSFTSAPIGTDRDDILLAMEYRGIDALLSQNDVAIIKAEPTKESTLHKYREHYEVGDVVTVSGAYSEVTTMRISEYVEIEDENGESGYPTLAAV
jgi:hypothetical protein